MNKEKVRAKSADFFLCDIASTDEVFVNFIAFIFPIKADFRHIRRAIRR
jgi:hypothetical protein